MNLHGTEQLKTAPRAARRKAKRRPMMLEQELAVRLRRAEGQLRGVRKMVGEGAYCIDLLQQLAAARRALDKIALLLLRDHLQTCVRDAFSRHQAGEKIDELVETLDRYLA